MIDRNGSLILQLEGASETSFEYGPHGLITKITPPTGSPWEFAYDGQLSWRKIVKAGVATYFLWNAFNQLEERDATGTLKARYTHGDPIVPGVGSVVEAQRITATTTYYQYLHMDHQGSVRAITNHAEVTQIAYTTDAFGSQIVAPTGANTAIPNDLIFHTNWITADTAGGRFCISPSRLYGPAIGGFLERDPLPYGQKVAGAAMGNALASYDKSVFHGTFANANQISSVAALTNNSGSIVERYHYRDLGRFTGRDPLGYVEGMSLYNGFFVPNGLDPWGLRDLTAEELSIINKLEELARKALQANDEEFAIAVRKLKAEFVKIIQDIQPTEKDPARVRILNAAFDVWQDKKDASSYLQESKEHGAWAGKNKYNKYVADVLTDAGYDSEFKLNPLGPRPRPPLAGEWANTFIIGEFKVILETTVTEQFGGNW